jgi:hypothetical protein
MALNKNFSVAGVTINNGYLRVSQLFGDKHNIGFVLSYQVNQSEPALKLEQFDFKPVMNESNFIKQAYEHLKTVPEFSDATDC